MRIPPVAVALLAVLVIAAPSRGAAAETRYTVGLTEVRVSRLDASRLVVSFVGAGDIRGLVSLTLDVGPAGAVTGQWALVSRYQVEVHDGTGTPDGDAPDHPGGPESLVVHERGTLAGRITGGDVVTDGAGTAIGLRGLQLTITSGSLEFAGAAGTGLAEVHDFGAPGKMRLDVSGGLP